MSEDIIDLLTRHELVLSELYGAFAAGLPGYFDFWNEMVTEERAHADVLCELKKRLPGEDVFVAAGKFRPEAVQTSIEYVHKQIKKMQSSGITPIRALALALDMESSALDKDFFEVFQSDRKSIISEFAALREHTKAHAKRISELLAKERLKNENA